MLSNDNEIWRPNQEHLGKTEEVDTHNERIRCGRWLWRHRSNETKTLS